MRKSSTPEVNDSCTMCGKMCAVRNMNKVMQGKRYKYIKNDDK